jgi:hypothetical protein
MAEFDLRRLRLLNQRLLESPFEQPAQVVSWLGAVQAQDFLAALWAVGQRMQAASQSAVVKAFNAGSLLRTHVLRPTWHFISPADIRWMLALTAPRINAQSAYQYRRLGLDEAVFECSNAVLEGELKGGRQLTRDELGTALVQAGIAIPERLALTYLMMRAELDGVICSGARRGKQFTYALLAERAPEAIILTREESLAELARRYFTSHGPASLHDFSWWSGLTISEARRGVELAGSLLTSEVVEGRTCWFAPLVAPPAAASADQSQAAHLLPNFDEYSVGYAERSALVDPRLAAKVNVQDAFVLLGPLVLVDGLACGTWKRTLNKGSVLIELNPFTELADSTREAVRRAAQRYGEFLEIPAVISWEAFAG